MWQKFSSILAVAKRSAAGAPLRFFVSLEDIKALRSLSAAPISDCKKALQATNSMSQAMDWLRERGAAKSFQLQKSGRAAEEGLVAVHAPSDNDASILHAVCETDFVQRNSLFQAYLNDVVASALCHQVPSTGASGFHDIDTKILLNLPLDSNGKHRGALAGLALADLVGKVRENISLRKAARIDAFPGIVGSYVHGCVNKAQYPGLGKAAAVVAVGVGVEEQSKIVLPEKIVEGVLRPFAKKLAMHIVAAKPKYVDENSIPVDILESERIFLLKQEAMDGSERSDDILKRVINGRMKKFISQVTLLHQSHLIEPQSPEVSQVLADVSKAAGVPLYIKGFVLLP